MPSEEVWQQVHADLMQKLNLPCRLEFSNKAKVGRHTFGDDGTCCITVNLEADFRVPAHLILHEAAHHIEQPCDCFGHCEHWAATLCGMYRETGTPLPRTTSFIEFAKAAGIERKNYAREE